MILLIDVHNMVHRAAHSHRELWSRNSGQFTGAYYGMFSMLVKLVSELKPEHVWLVSDPNEPEHKGNWRTKYLPEYKQRHKTRKPEEEKQYRAIQSQFVELRTALLCLNVFWFEQAFLEADDIIGYLRMQYADTPIICISTDKDMFPLISPNFTIYYPGKPPRWLTCDNFFEQSAHFFKENKKLPAEQQIRLTLQQWAEYRWLQGDKSDMIPGVPSCAEKRALMILREYGGFNAFCEKIAAQVAAGEKVTKTLQKLSNENAQKAYALNAHLMRLNPPQGPTPLDMSNPLCKMGSANLDYLRAWMAYHEFSTSEDSLLAKLENSSLARKLSSPYEKLPRY